MRAYERPTLTRIGSFGKVTGLVKKKGPPDFLGQHSILR